MLDPERLQGLGYRVEVEHGRVIIGVDDGEAAAQPDVYRPPTTLHTDHAVKRLGSGVTNMARFDGHDTMPDM